jgi:hypothetical protein
MLKIIILLAALCPAALAGRQVDHDPTFEQVLNATSDSSAPAPAGTPQDCAAFFDGLQKRPVKAFLEDVLREKVKLRPECKSYEPAGISSFTFTHQEQGGARLSLVSELYATCVKDHFDAQDRTIKGQCIVDLILARLIRLSRPLDESTNLKTLSQTELFKDLYRWSVEGPSATTPRILSEAEELRKRLPRSTTATKLVIQALSSSVDPSQKESAPVIDRILRLSTEGTRIDPRDQDFGDFGCLFEAKFKGEKGLYERLTAQAKKEPAGSVFFCLAYLDFTHGNSASASANVDRAIKADPKNENYLGTRENMHAGVDHPFVVHLDVFSLHLDAE